ncbi:MAG: hypothetical protein ABIN58_05325 [candidate division WOR-3 bacterium]
MPDRSPFGRESRLQILKQHLDEFDQSYHIAPETAWMFVYRELLWIDGSTGLAHLYESDKAQPGRPWYQRTLAFNQMLREQFGGISQDELKQRIDRLFRACLEKMIQSGEVAPEEVESVADLAPDFPAEMTGEVKGEVITDAQMEDRPERYVPDAALVAEFAALLVRQTGMSQPLAEYFARKMVIRARFYFTVERKRQNVLGEGFEDLLQLLVVRLSRVPENRIVVRRRADQLPGFQRQTTRERIEAPDIAIISGDRTHLLASVKWSLRHDRQKQLSDELDCYVDLLSQDQFPEYILVTNEYDPGRLVNTDGLARRGKRIDRIYHINLDFLLKVLQDHPRVSDLKPMVGSGRLRSMKDFLEDMAKLSQL